MICVYFNPRSHERSDETYKTLYISDLISIHAPTRGATVFRRAERNSCRISIHAPTRGATIPNIDIPDVAGFQSTLPREERRDNMKVIAEIEKFQSTLPREERHNTTGWQGTGEIISIHAPTRGATIRITVGLLITQNFNPRSHERSDVCYVGF